MGGGRSSSSATTHNETNQYDNRIGAAEGSVVIAHSHGATYSPTTQTWYTATDHGAVSASLDAMGEAVRESVKAQESTAKSALDLGAKAIEGNATVLDRAFEFGETAFGFGSEALDMIRQNQESAFDFVSGAIKSTEERTYQDTVKWAALLGISYFAVKAMGVLK
ncbi:hypothetical protein [Arenibaculum sp.]|jgi:fructose-1,6-bisphosphatase/inositol monophosphatase family enzyme|uniref:hypothetical protein n=1 Tax=Arenibaculum sp. TaxID=2865862 RepID=UPI002E130EF3|nr:hypothetical protein [Arenibaculum sp.]